MTLGAFLRAQSGDPGPWNCSTMPADWCVSLGHPDFAAAWRDIVEPGLCDAVPADAGGLLNLWELGIGNALPAVVDDLRRGDIAVVYVAGTERGAIWTGEHWALRGERAVHWLPEGSAALLKAWRP